MRAPDHVRGGGLTVPYSELRKTEVLTMGEVSQNDLSFIRRL